MAAGAVGGAAGARCGGTCLAWWGGWDEDDKGEGSAAAACWAALTNGACRPGTGGADATDEGRAGRCLRERPPLLLLGCGEDADMDDCCHCDR